MRQRRSEIEIARLSPGGPLEDIRYVLAIGTVLIAALSTIVYFIYA